MMNLKPFLLSFIAIALLASCNSLQPEFGLANDYFPSAQYLREGIVNKYYSHQTSSSNSDVVTQIRYNAFQLKSANELKASSYNSAMELVSETLYRFEDNKMKIVEAKEYAGEDTLFTQIKSPEIIDWAGNDALYAYEFENLRGRLTKASQRQLASKDTVVEGRKAKLIYQESTYKNLLNGDSAVFELKFIRTYAQGIGLYGYHMTYERGATRLELVEQIPLKEFQKMADHGIRRVGYIDPRSVLDPDSGFQLCGRHDDVADYYNGQDKRAQYVGGKKAIWELTNKHLDKSKLFKESGYLTLRFIVNCKGEAGWFTMEEADLDFQPKRFPAETIQHFFEILYQHPNWKPCIIREEARDAYTYITFKLKDGEIIEILP